MLLKSMARHARSTSRLSLNNHIQKDQERKHAQNAAHRMEPSPPEKKLTRLLRTFVKGWVEQLFVGWQYDYKRKGNERYQQHAT